MKWPCETMETKVLGIGNILMSDDGYGVRVVEELKQNYSFSDDLLIMDGGTLGFELLSHLRGTKRLLIVDAIKGSEPPGTFYVFRDEEVQQYFQTKISIHELGIQEVLYAMQLLDEVLPKLVIIGVEPEELGLGVTLSQTVAQQVRRGVDAILEELAKWGICGKMQRVNAI